MNKKYLSILPSHQQGTEIKHVPCSCTNKFFAPTQIKEDKIIVINKKIIIKTLFWILSSLCIVDCGFW